LRNAWLNAWLYAWLNAWFYAWFYAWLNYAWFTPVLRLVNAWFLRLVYAWLIELVDRAVLIELVERAVLIELVDRAGWWCIPCVHPLYTPWVHLHRQPSTYTGDFSAARARTNRPVPPRGL